MNTPKAPSKIDPSQKQALIFAIVMSLVTTLWALVTRWVCFLGLLRPHEWTLAANIARWGWVVVYFCLVSFGLFSLLMFRLDPSPKRPLSKWYILGLFVPFLMVVSLLLGRLDGALILSYGYESISALQKWVTGHDEVQEEAHRFQQFEYGFLSLKLVLFIPALLLRSLHIALVV